MMIVQKPVAFDDFRLGRQGHAVLGIVIHIEDGSEAGTDAWFDDPQSHVSSHYSVSKFGEIHQYVQEQDEAFHAGTVVEPTWDLVLEHPGVNPNLYTVGLEHEGLATDEWPDTQYQASAQLIADIANRHGMAIDAAHIAPHHSIRANKTCPGRCDMTKLIALAQNIG